METTKYLIKENNGKFSVIKEGNTRASKVFTTMVDAGDWVLDQGAELIVEQTGCGCEECCCGNSVEQSDTQSENDKPKTYINDYKYQTPMASGNNVSKPSFKEKIKWLFNRLFK